MRTHRLMVHVLLGVVLAAAPLVVAQEVAPPASQPSAGNAAPRLEVEPSEVDFGEVWHGATPIAEVTLTNRGTAPLEIIKIDPGCGCTAVNKPKSPLAPGESDVLQIKYKSGTKHPGKINRSVSIRTNDPERPMTTVHLRGEVKQFVKRSPTDSIAFGELSSGEAATKSLDLTVTYDKPLYLKLKEPAPGPFTLKLEELKPGAEYKLSATSVPPLGNGVSSMNAVLLTGLKDVPEVPIAVRAIVRPRVSVSPSWLYVPEKINRSMTKRVRVNYLSSRPVKITKLESDCDKVTATLADLPNPPTGRRFAFHVINVTLPPGNQLPEQGAKLFIYTDDPEEQYAKLVVEITNQPPKRGHPLGMQNRGVELRGGDSHREFQAGKPENEKPAEDQPGTASKQP